MWFSISALRSGGPAASPGGPRSRETPQEGPGRFAGRHRGPDHRAHVLGQGVVRKPGIVQRLRQPPAARPHLRPQRLGGRLADSTRARSRRWSAARSSTRSASPSRRCRRGSGSSIKTRCAGQIGSLVELLQGRLSKSVIDIVTAHDGGLFPKPSEIKMSCSCPDWAGMCKHVAAVHVRRRSASGSPTGVALPPAQGRSPGIDRGSRVECRQADRDEEEDARRRPTWPAFSGSRSRQPEDDGCSATVRRAAGEAKAAARPARRVRLRKPSRLPQSGLAGHVARRVPGRAKRVRRQSVVPSYEPEAEATDCPYRNTSLTLPARTAALAPSDRWREMTTKPMPKITFHGGTIILEDRLLAGVRLEVEGTRIAAIGPMPRRRRRPWARGRSARRLPRSRFCGHPRPRRRRG